MKNKLRLIVPVTLTMFTVAVIFSFSQIQYEKNGLTRGLEINAESASENIMTPIQTILNEGDTKELKALLQWAKDDENLLGIVVYRDGQIASYAAGTQSSSINRRLAQVHESFLQNRQSPSFRKLSGQLLHFHMKQFPLNKSGEGTLLLIQNAARIQNLPNEIVLRNLFLLLKLMLTSVILIILVPFLETVALNAHMNRRLIRIR